MSPQSLADSVGLVGDQWDATPPDSTAATCQPGAAPVSRACLHCGLPTLVPAQQSPEQPVFCCSGCRGAHALIEGWGLADFYALRDQMTITGSALAAGGQSKYDQFDNPDFLGDSTPRATGDGSQSTELGVQGLHCAACAWLIERVLVRQPGVASARVKMSDHTLRVIFDADTTRLSSIARLLDRLGYQLTPLDRSREQHLQVENRHLLIQIAMAGFLAANAMWIAIALYAGQFSGLAADHKYFFGLVGIALGTAAVVGPGRTFFRGAVAALKTRTPHMDLPIALGLSVGTVAGLWHAVTGSGPIYFDCLATLVFLLLIGRWIQFRQQHRAARAVELMLRVTPRHAELVGEDQSTCSVLVERLNQGDWIRVAAGQPVPADGTIVLGSSQLNRSLLTGESQPVAVAVGDRVEAGTINLVAPLTVQVDAVGRDSRIGRVMQSVELAATQKTPIVQAADRLGGAFVVIVIVLAAITFARWLPVSLHDATNYATALLIVACPCALALATPLAIAVGIGRAARADILIREGLVLQRLARPGMLWFDKTGTLTEGRQRARLVWGGPAALRLAASVESQCPHPIAQAIVTAAELAGESNLPTADQITLSAGGIAGRVGQLQVWIGNAAYLEKHGFEIDAPLAERARQLLAAGETPIFIAADGQLRGLLGLSDPLRDQAADVVAQARQLGWTVGMISGDHPEIAGRVGRQLGIDSQLCHGGVSPEQKLATIQCSREQFATVVMVGDGANDAAALAAADIGIAVRGGAEVSLHAAPVFLSSQQLSRLIGLIRGSRVTTRVIYMNFAVSLIYNLVTVYCALVGWISPLMAAILMPLSSATVLGLTFAIPSFPQQPASVVSARSSQPEPVP